MKVTLENKWLALLFYVLVFFLFREWLLPVMELTETNYLTLFLVFIGMCFMFSFVHAKGWISAPLKILYIAWVLVYVYTDTIFFSSSAIDFLITDLITNMKALVAQDWVSVTDSFRTVLFFALIWMTAYLIHHWISIRLNIFLFFLMTVVFIAALDTFSPYSGDKAIVRVMIIGLLLSGLLKIAQLFKQNEVGIPRSTYGPLIVPLILLIGVSGALGYLLPKAGPVWEDPVPFIQSFADGAGGGPNGNGSLGKIGYDEDDSKLGGAFAGDDTVVFEAVVRTAQYWKIETKDTYTSRGWEQSVASSEVRNYTVGDLIETDFPPNREEESLEASLVFEKTYPFILYPYGTETVIADGDTTFSVATNTQKMNTFQQNDEVELSNYRVTFSEPTYSLTALREVTTESLANLPTEFDRYLQLPEKLPERVGELATSITEDEVRLYDKVKEIERYFAQNSYIYDQRNVAVPEAGEDYVDQFLFDTKRGYCDNFSSSMVVLLRSLDIPARWVKGFAEGEEVGRQNGNRIFEVTNNNAHSWVEAYLPGIGWMPFEPTIGFSGAGNIDFDVEYDSTEAPEPLPPKKPDKPKSTSKDKDETISEKFSEFVKDTVSWVSDHKGRILLWLAVAIGISALLFSIRKKWMPKLLVPYYRLRKENWNSFEQSYHRLLKQLSLYGIERREGQTLKTYAKYVDSFFGSNDMRELTSAYEKGFYGKKIDKHEWAKLRESWEYLINRTSG
ncbi:MAG: transglutaminase domain-containing protein [Paenisporosarcina sp.]